MASLPYNHDLITSKYPNIPPKLKPKQEEVVCSILKGTDTVAILPTGYGKSLCFVLPAIYKEGVALVVSPLKALQDNQMAALRNWGVSCAILNEDTDVESVKKGTC